MNEYLPVVDDKREIFPVLSNFPTPVIFVVDKKNLAQKLDNSFQISPQ